MVIVTDYNTRRNEIKNEFFFYRFCRSQLELVVPVDIKLRRIVELAVKVQETA